MYLELPVVGLPYKNSKLVFLPLHVLSEKHLKLTSVKKASNRTPFFPSAAILEKYFLIRSGFILLNHFKVFLSILFRDSHDTGVSLNLPQQQFICNI